MNANTIGTRAFKEFLNFKSDEASASIPPGSPVVFSIDATEDGFAAYLPSSAGAAKCPELFAGIYNGPGALLPGQMSKAQVFGLCEYAIVVQQSRANSGSNFSSAAALSVGQPLKIDTVNNALATDSQVTGAMTIVTGATTATVAVDFGDGHAPLFVMAQTLASADSAASTTSDTRVKITYGVKIFLRAM